MSTEKKQRLAKNTVVLYIRMLFTMFIALFTSRYVLKALGVEDYGIYNLVGGFVVLFSFMMSGMRSSTQRFLSYEMGCGDITSLTKVFSVCLSSHILMSFVVIILGETVGLWVVNTFLEIPYERLFATNIIYQFSIITLCLNILTVPYNACVVSREKMSIYAYISIIESLIKLGIAIGVIYVTYDHLIIYGLLIMLVGLCQFLMYYIICRKKFEETKYVFIWDKEQFKKVFSFSGFTMLGQMGQVCSNQGVSVLINMFFGVVLNAAIGVANQVKVAVESLSVNFLAAFQPQITKSYAEKNYDYLNKLIESSSKLSYFLIFVCAIPVCINIDIILKLWLGTVPDYTNIFCIIFISSSLISSIGNPLWMSVFATGNIKKIQLMTTSLYFLDVLFVYLLFKANFNPVAGPGIKLIIDILLLFTRLYCAKLYVVEGFSLKRYVMNVLLPIILITILSLLPVTSLFVVGNNLYISVAVTVISIFISVLSIYYIGLNSSEKNLIKTFIMKLKNKR